VMYGIGKGVEQNYVTAYAWAIIAAANGNKTAPRFKSEFLEGKMTSAQIAEGQKLSREMVKKNPKLLNK
jgi:TPR repeat protein